MKMWSGRFRQPLDPGFESWQRSFPFDKQLLNEELAASAAYAKALAGIGILSPAELEQITNALRDIGTDAQKDPALLDDEESEDVHHFVERQVVTRIGEVGYKLHSGRSRNEQITTDLRLYIRAQIDATLTGIAGLMETFVRRATEAGERTMPSYTHLQRAEPVLVAHWLLAYFEMFARDADRLTDCRKRLNVSPLGSGAIAGSTLPLDRHDIARTLEFDAPTANSMDATSDRDFAIEFLQALSVLGIHLSRWSEELIIFCSQEFGFVKLPESYSTGSSAMPQKQNPDALELIRAKSARLIGNASAVTINMKGLPLAYNKDLQETQQPIFDSAITALAMLQHATGFMREVQFDFAVMAAAAQSHFMNAFAAATYLVGKGVPFRRAHEIIGAAVRLCMDKGCELQALPLSELQSLNPAFEQDFYDAIQLNAVLDCHDVIGGTARARVKKALAEAGGRIAKLKGEAHAHA
ncbi:MAG: argininosuccinate lyase [Acidobacteriales bacterium]|nr:argininosuccinate lyase [Terriglobales bacterium]